MRQTIVVVLLLLGFLFSGSIVAKAALSPEITHGPVTGYATGVRAMKIWVKTNTDAKVQIEYSENKDLVNPSISRAVYAKRWKDYTAVIKIRNLKRSTRYYYRLVLNGDVQADIYEFTTRPGNWQNKTFSFAVLSDWSRAKAASYSTIAGLNPAFLIFQGDLDHRLSDATSPQPPTLDIMRAMHADLKGTDYGSPLGRDYRDHLMKFPMLHVWDDHDYGMDNGNKNFVNRSDALRAFKEYYLAPIWQSSNGIWHSLRYAQAEIFMLDLRSQRDCIFDPIYNPFCPAYTPASSMLGAAQKTWLKAKLLNSRAKWKFIISSVPFNPTVQKNDAWDSFPDEREELVEFISQNNISGVVILSGDLHTGGAIDDGTNSDIPEISVPHANMNPKNCGTTGQYVAGLGTWSDGLICGTDNPGFLNVTVSPDEVMLEIMGVDGTVRKSLMLD